MAIVPLSKLSLCGLCTEKTTVLRQLQAMGGGHLIPLNTAFFVEKSMQIHHQSAQVKQAINYLNQCASKRHQVLEQDDFQLDTIVQQVLAIQTRIRALSDQCDFLLKRIEKVKPWGDFNLPARGELKDIKCWFYIIPKRLMSKIQNNVTFQVVHEDNMCCYVVVLSITEPEVNQLPVPRTHTGKASLSQLNKTLQRIELEREDKQAERESLTRWITLMEQSLLEYHAGLALRQAESLTWDETEFFALQLWIPDAARSQFKHFAIQNNLAYLFEPVTEQDTPPTLLKNNEWVTGGEEVIKFYQMPAYHDWDPSLVVFFSFALFFAMILSDAGYALVLACLLALKWRSIGVSLAGRRLRVLASVTIGTACLWGVLSGGYFGYSPPAESLLGHFKQFDINDFDGMMHLSIAVGVIHLAMANLIKAYQLAPKNRAWSSVAWACLVVIGYLRWLDIQSFNPISDGLIAVAVILLLIFSSDRTINKPVDYFWRILDGLKNLTAVTKIFGDVLSYMRLFALGLASASLALTFNQLAGQAHSSASGLGILVSILILLLGHGLNLLLCLMSGVVHGLRLNFIEFYNWSVSDEGYPFKAFNHPAKDKKL